MSRQQSSCLLWMRTYGTSLPHLLIATGSVALASPKLKLGGSDGERDFGCLAWLLLSQLLLINYRDNWPALSGEEEGNSSFFAIGPPCGADFKETNTKFLTK